MRPQFTEEGDIFVIAWCLHFAGSPAREFDSARLCDAAGNVIETRLMNEKEAQQNGGVPHSLRSASVLMYGCVVVYSKQIDFLKDESQHALSTIQQVRLLERRRCRGVVVLGCCSF